jgi:hypothetical protein
MAAQKKMVTAVFRDRANAQLAYDELISRGYTPKEINVLMSDATRAAYYPTQHETIKPGSAAVEGIAAGGVIGTAVGATLAAIAAIAPAVAFPGLGIVIAGPVVAALAGGGAGAVAGGVLGGLIGLGIPESNAKAYEAALRAGGVVVGVAPHNGEGASDIIHLFEEHRGENVCTC